MKENNEDNYIDKVYVDVEDLIENEVYLLEHYKNPENSILGIYKGKSTFSSVNNITLQIISGCSSIPDHDASKFIGMTVIITGLEKCKFIKL